MGTAENPGIHGPRVKPEDVDFYDLRDIWPAEEVVIRKYGMLVYHVEAFSFRVAERISAKAQNKLNIAIWYASRIMSKA